MRKVILVLLMGLWSLTLGGSPVRADGMILPESLSPDYLAVRYHRVTVTIRDNYAVTQVEQEFYNPHPFPVEGRYTFPVPPEAMVSEFRAAVDGQPQAITRQDAATTNVALYDIVAQRRDPSLLQYADWDSLAFDLTLALSVPICVYLCLSVAILAVQDRHQPTRKRQLRSSLSLYPIRIAFALSVTSPLGNRSGAQ